MSKYHGLCLPMMLLMLLLCYALGWHQHPPQPTREHQTTMSTKMIHSCPTLPCTTTVSATLCNISMLFKLNNIGGEGGLMA